MISTRLHDSNKIIPCISEKKASRAGGGGAGGGGESEGRGVGEGESHTTYN